MRPRTLVPLLALVVLSPAHGQDPIPTVTPATAKERVGNIARLCGQVVDFSCHRPTSTMFLRLSGDSDGSAAIQIRNTSTSLGRRRDSQFFGQMVCATGQVERDAAGLFVAVPGPASAEVLQQDRLPAVFAPDAYEWSCDPGVVMPRVTREVKPAYTPSAMKDRTQGQVLMQAVVKADGRVGDVRVIRSLRPDLDAEAVRALRQWRFTPGRYAGKPADVFTTFEMTFTLGR